MTKGIKRAVAILATIMIFLLTAAFLLFNPAQTAFAARSDNGTGWVIIDEIYDAGKSIFKAEELKKLYKALTGADTFASVQSAASGNKTSADFRTQNSGKNISVWFGGKKWDAVYLTKDKSGNVVLDLWQSADNVTVTSKWANQAIDNASAVYPSSMYSTSYIRVQTLNNGGYASTTISTIPNAKYEPKTSESDNTYARFTSSKATDSVVSYLVQPKNVAYQETENAIGNSSLQYSCHNDAYGTPSGGKWYNNKNYEGKGTAHDETKYEAWQNDYLWLPSLAETGDSDTAKQNGLWKTDDSLRSTEAKSGKSDAWLRSGYYIYVGSAYTLSTSGSSGYYGVTQEYHLVRPALHLNLTAANSTATFAETVTAEWKSGVPTTFYTTGENLLTDIASYIEVKTESGTTLDKSAYSVSVNGGSNQITTAGSYNLKITLNSGDYQFADGTNSATLTATVAEAKVRVSKGGGVWGFGSFNDASAWMWPETNFTVTLYDDVKDGAFVVNTNNGNVTFDLNGNTFNDNIQIVGGSLTLKGSGTVSGKIDVQSGTFNLNGSYVKTVSLESGTFINVQSAPASGQIAIKVDNFATPYKVLSWTGSDPTSHFKSADEKACFYKGTGENAAYIGKHSFVFEGGPTWNEPSATFTGIKCEHCGATATATATAEESRVSASCTTENITYTAKVNLSNLQPAFDSDHAAIKGGTITKTKTVNGSKKETPTHEWEYSASADGKLTATCKHAHTAESDGKQTFTVTVTVPQNAVYNGKAQPATISGDTANFPGGYSVTYKYKGFGGADYQAHGDPKEAGQYQVIIAASSQSATLTFEIKKATITLKWEAEDSYTYTGSAQTAPTASIESGNYDGGDLTVSSAIAGDSEMKGSFMNAGEYTFAATLGGAAAGNYELSAKTEKFSTEIYKAQLTKPTSAGTATVEGAYSGSPYEITVKDFNDKMTATLSDNTKSSFVSDKFTATKAGTYRLTITITDQNNYMWKGGNSTDEVEFTIKIAKATVDLPQGVKLTAGQYKPEGYTVKISGYDNALMEYDTTGDGAGFDETEFTAENVGEYTLTISLQDTDDYEWADEASDPTFTITISKRELAKPTGSASGEYKGVDQSVVLVGFDSSTMQQKSLTDGATFVAGSGIFSAKNKGEYTLVIELKDKSNYKWTGSDQSDPTFTIGITAAQLTYSFTNSGNAYDGEEREVGIAFVTQNGEILEKGTDYIIKIEKVTGALSNGLPLGAGSYTVTIILQGTTKANNYTLASGNPTTFTIEKAKLTKPTSAGTATVEGTYSGSPYEITVKDFTDKMTATLDESGKSTFDNTTFAATDAGEYTLTITLRYPENYEWDGADKSDPEFTINISKRELAKPEGSAGGEYKGEDYVVELANYDNATMKTSPVPAGSTFEQKDGKWQFSARDVGTYSITILLKDTDNYKWTGEGADPVITISIGKTELTFTLKESSKTYTGLQHTDIDVDFDGDFGHLTKDSDYTLTFEAIDGKLEEGLPKGAGKYTVTLALKGKAEQDYDLKVNTAQYEISKADITFSLKQATATYTGTAHSDIDVTFEGIQNSEEFTKGTHYTLSFEAQRDTTAQLDGSLPKTVGKYTVTVTLRGERYDNYTVTTVPQTYEITKASITVSGEYSDSRDYNGDKYEQKITAAGETHGLTVTMPVKDPGFEITIATDKSADTYTDDIEVEYDDVNFALTNDGTYTVTINKAKLTLSLTVVDGGKTYDGYDTATVTGEITKGIFYTDDVEIAGITANFNDKNVGENKPITVTEVTLGGTMADNYTVIIEDLPKIEGKIDKRTAEVVWDGYEGLIYNGEPQTITATATGVIIDGHAEEVILAIAYASDTPGIELVGNVPQNAGDYTATATTSNGNYALSGNTRAYTVAKQQVTAPTIASKVYNRAPQTATVAASPLYEVTENIGGTDVDNYNVRLTLTDSKNYKWVKDGTEYETDYIDLIFAITKATYDMSGVTFEDFSIIYDAHEHSIYIGGDLPFEEVTVRYENNGQTKVGEYIVTAIFTGDADNYEPILSKTATLTILKVSHDLGGITFADVTVKYDGEAHSIYIEGDLPTNVTVDYEGNGQVDPAIYTVTAIFSDPDGEFEEKTAILTILRTQTQTAPSDEEEGDPGEPGSEEDTDVPEVFIESEEGFDPTLELVVEKVEDVERDYLAWGKDEVSQRYSVKLCKDGVEVPIEGKVTVRLLIPEAFRDKDFDLMAVARTGGVSPSGIKLTAAPIGATGPTNVEFTRDGDYVVFESDGLSEYVFTSSYAPYFPVLIVATTILIADVAIMAVLAVVIKKKRYTNVR